MAEKSGKKSADGRALDICAVGLGQAGGNLAAEWHRRGNRAILFNTARGDMNSLQHFEGLNVAAEQCFHIGLDGAEGAGRDPDFGAACIDANSTLIRDAVAKNLVGADAIFLCAGLGGGTGSALHALARIVSDIGIPLVAVVTIPAKSESGITKVNAVRAVEELLNCNLAGLLFIDNTRLVESFPDVDMVSYFPTVNAEVLGSLDKLNRFDSHDGSWGIRAFDSEDLRKVLLSGSVLQTHVVTLSTTAPLRSEELVDVVQECVDGGHHFATGLTLADCAYLALVVMGPEAALRQTSMRAFDDTIAALKERTDGGAVYEGLYVDTQKDAKTKAHVLVASLALPKRIRDLLDDARDEGERLMGKIASDIPHLAVDELASLKLFRAPNRVSTTRRETPARRNLGAQLSAHLGARSPTSVAVDVKSASVVKVNATKETAPKGTAPKDAIPRESGRPRVGIGDWHDEGASVHVQEPTELRASPRDDIATDRSEFAAPDDGDAKKPMVRVGGANLPDRAVEPDEKTVAVVDKELRMVGVQNQRPDAHLFRADAPELELDDDPATEQHPRGRTHVANVPDDVLLSSVLEAETGKVDSDYQSIYQDLIERFQESDDQRGRRRVARRLVDDAQSSSVETRALAVWAMSKLNDRGFRSALERSAKDKNPEIANLAIQGLERIKRG